MTPALTIVHDAGNFVGYFVWSAQQIRFPVAEDNPPCFLKRFGLTAIAFDVSRHLRDPVTRVVSAGELCKSALKVTAVPEVSVAENSDALLAKHDVWATWQPGGVKAISETASPQLTPQHELTTRVGLLASAARGSRGFLGRGKQASERRCCSRATHPVRSVRFFSDARARAKQRLNLQGCCALADIGPRA